jgi:poly(beta-D-mannuronate) lyase
MKRLLLLQSLLLVCIVCFSNTILVKNIAELNAANKQAQPGDIIILQNGEWKNVTIALNCTGTNEKPVFFKAQTSGKVVLSGNSMLKLGGNFIVVDGLYFLSGCAGNNAVIDFRVNKNELANNCRVTNCVINDFNNPKRLDENNWVLFYGKSNRLDHCSFINKKNMGVLLAVVLDDDRSRENFHSIDHNYFGVRIPLASNGGEIIRVGVSQHCQFNSNTQIVDNYFEHCDGETEIISIKSGSNVVRGNLFKECQGGVVLRHGNNNTVENNIFLGNDKEGTGGVRVINKGQWVINNLFYKCRGVDFRSPLSVMNGIPNSPAFRYVQVTDAVIANNTWYDCSPVSFCEGSDTERTLPPFNTLLLNNIFYNTKDDIIYKTFDNINGFSFSGNEISKEVKQDVANGFSPASLTVQKNDNKPFVVSGSVAVIPDSLQQLAKQRLHHVLPAKKGFSDLALAKKIQANSYSDCGAKWFDKSNLSISAKPIRVNCKNADEVYLQLGRKEPVSIFLSGQQYILDKPFVISKEVEFTAGGKERMVIDIATNSMQAVFIISGSGRLFLHNMRINGSMVKANSFISNDSTGLSDHYSLGVSGSTLRNFNRDKGCQNLFNAYKSMVADSIIVSDCYFENINADGFMLNNEKDNKGYYSAEKISFFGNTLGGLKGVLLSVYRGGNDESTMGPKLSFKYNRIKNCNTTDAASALIELTGVQQSNISGNEFTNCNELPYNSSAGSKTTGKLIRYIDFVRASHIFKNNSINSSGSVLVDKFVIQMENIFKGKP